MNVVDSDHAGLKQSQESHGQALGEPNDRVTVKVECTLSTRVIVQLSIMLSICMFVYAQGAAYVEFDVHLSRDSVPIVYHDLTCCISTKKVPIKRACVNRLGSQKRILYHLYSWLVILYCINISY